MAKYKVWKFDWRRRWVWKGNFDLIGGCWTVFDENGWEEVLEIERGVERGVLEWIAKWFEIYWQYGGCLGDE